MGLAHGRRHGMPARQDPQLRETASVPTALNRSRGTWLPAMADVAARTLLGSSLGCFGRNPRLAARNTATHKRVSSPDPKDDFERWQRVLEIHRARQGWTFEVIADLDSGMNHQKRGLTRLLHAVIDGEVGHLVSMNKDRFLVYPADASVLAPTHAGPFPRHLPYGSGARQILCEQGILIPPDFVDPALHADSAGGVMLIVARQFARHRKLPQIHADLGNSSCE